MARGLQAGEDDTRTLTDLLVSQVSHSVCGRERAYVCVRERERERERVSEREKVLVRDKACVYCVGEREREK